MLNLDKILLISDTHGNHKLLEKVLKHNHDCKYLIHLGDEPDDLEHHPELTSDMQIFYVYGIFHHKWTEQNASNKFMIKNTRFKIAHTPADIKVEEHDHIYCFGHTHHRHFERDGKSLYINPGHLKNNNDRGEVAGYVVIELKDDVKIKFFDYKHKLLEVQRV